MKSSEEIFSSVYTLFRNYGIKSMTMDDIARHLGMSKKTLYKYVTDKTDLVQKVFMYVKSSERFVVPNRNTNVNAIEFFYGIYHKVLQNIKDFNPHLLYDLKKYYPDIYNKIKEMRKQTVVTIVKGNLEQGISEGIYRNDINADIIAEVHHLKMEALIESNFLNTGRYGLEEIFTELFKYHIYAIVNEKGREILKQLKFFEL